MNIQNTRTLNGKEEKAMFLNPMLRKISEIKGNTAEISTYAGIFGKFLYFMVMIIAGIALALMFKSFGGISVEAVTDELIVSKYAVITVLASAFVFLVFPLIAFIVRKTIPVLGAVYCAGIGYLLGFILALDSDFNGYLLLATVITMSIVTVMGFLYFKGIIRVTDKFRLITATLFSTLILSSSAMLVCYFIPGLRDSVLMLTENPVISIASSVGGTVIASLFLLIDFETVRNTVEDRLPKEYEWFAAFGVVFTVVWLYLKVLDLVTKIQSN